MSQSAPADVDPPSEYIPLVEAGEGAGLEYRLSGSTQWQSNMSVQNAAQHQSQFAKDMAGQFANSISPDKFIETYLRKRSGRGPLPVLEFPDEAVTDESLWADIINESGLCPHLKFFCTKDANSGSPSMDGQKRRPDGAAFPKMTTAAEKKLVDSNFETLFSDAPLLIERKLRTQDGFRATPDDYIGVEKQTDTSEHVRGQLITYAMHQHHQQPRVASYQVLLVDKLARLIRFDRAGVVCTHLFDWMSGTILAEFLCRFDHADRVTRGYDPTVIPATSREIKAATEAFIKAGHDKTHAVRGPFYKYAVPVTNIEPTLPNPDASASSTTSGNKRKGKAQMRFFIAGCPITWSPSFTGRAGTGYICYDILGKGVHFMKDAWRIDHHSLFAEYQVYAKLGEKLRNSEGVETSVPHVPQLLCGGDLHFADGTLQRTRTEVIDAMGKPRPVQQYTHFRMVVVEVGKPLSSFKSVLELLTVLRDVVLAHKCALARGILHRDISAGNILVLRDASGKLLGGLLIDWDLCYMQEYARADETRWITGTWQFMSIALLERRKGHRHSQKDDLESILWVLCYCLARYTNLYNGPHASAVGFLNTCFDAARPASQQREDRPEAQRGGEAKRTALEDMENCRGGFIPKDIHPDLLRLLRDLATSVRFVHQRYLAEVNMAHYDLENPPDEDSDDFDAFAKAKRTLDAMEVEEKALRPASHETFLKILERARTRLQADRSEPSSAVHGSMMLGDRVKMHHEAERKKEKLEQEKSKSMREKNGGAEAGASTSVGALKRPRQDSDDVPLGRKTKSQRTAAGGSSRHSPVPEDDEPEE